MLPRMHDTAPTARLLHVFLQPTHQSYRRLGLRICTRPLRLTNMPKIVTVGLKASWTPSTKVLLQFPRFGSPALTASLAFAQRPNMSLGTRVLATFLRPYICKAWTNSRKKSLLLALMASRVSLGCSNYSLWMPTRYALTRRFNASCCSVCIITAAGRYLFCHLRRRLPC